MSEAGQLLDWSRDLVDRADRLTANLWPRAAAFLARQALETAVAELWRAKVPAVADCPARAQLLSLATALPDPTVARRAQHAFSALSRACHHHAYELAPTAAELRAWIDEVAFVVATCTGACGSD